MRWLGVGAVTLLAVMTACAGPDRSAEAAELEDEVRRQPAVRGVVLSYSKPITLDGGRIELVVRMEDTASAVQIARVVEVVYDAFGATHGDEEADLELQAGDDTIRVRSFESESTTRAVVDEVVTVLALRDRGALEIEVSGQDPLGGPRNPGSRNVLTLPQGSDEEDVLVALDEIERTIGDTRERWWRVRAAGGAGVGGSPGLPTAATLALWDELRQIATPLGEVAVFVEDSRDPDTPIRLVEVDLADVDVWTDTGAILRVAERHLERVRLANDLWSYELRVAGVPVTQIDPLTCTPQANSVEPPNPVDDALRTPRNCHVTQESAQ